MPQTVRQVRSFLGLTSYYRKFILHYADKAKPLHRLTEKHQKFIWTDECQKSFDLLKEALVSAPILAYPIEDGQFVLDTDASLVGLGAVLSQIQNGTEKVIAYYSRSFSRVERSYCVTRRELLAIISSIRHFHHYLYGRKIVVRTDHGALRWLLHFKNPEGQMARWFEVLAAYDFEIVHRAGRNHNNADALSRRPCLSDMCSHCERIEKKEEPCESSLNTKYLSEVSEEKMCSHAVNEHNSEKVEVMKTTKICNTTSQGSSQMSESQTNNISMKQHQHQDTLLKYIIEEKEKRSKPEWKDIASRDDVLKFYWQRWDSLEVKDQTLYYKFENMKGETHLLLVVPQSQRNFILKELHDGITGGHLGVKKTLNKVRS